MIKATIEGLGWCGERLVDSVQGPSEAIRQLAKAEFIALGFEEGIS